MQFLVHLVVTALLLLLVARLLPGIEVRDFVSAGLAALVLGIANALVWPVLVLLTLPITVLTLGLFLLVVNAIVFMLVAWIVPGFEVKGLGAAFLGSLLLTILNVIVGQVFGI